MEGMCMRNLLFYRNHFYVVQLHFLGYNFLNRELFAELLADCTRKGVSMSVIEQKTSDIGCCSSQAVNDKKTYSVLEIADILQISKSKAYELCKDADFKVVRLGRSIRISKASFDAWLDSLL